LVGRCGVSGGDAGNGQLAFEIALAQRIAETSARHEGVRSAKTTSMSDAITELVCHGDTVAIEGCTHLVSFAAGHEVIRQRKSETPCWSGP
jgi:hypothetical protein